MFEWGGCRHAVTWDPLNLRTLQEAVEKGRLQPGAVVTMKTLYDAGLLSKKIDHGVKLLGTVSPSHHNYLVYFVSSTSPFNFLGASSRSCSILYQLVSSIKYHFVSSCIIYHFLMYAGSGEIQQAAAPAGQPPTPHSSVHHIFPCNLKCQCARWPSFVFVCCLLLCPWS